MNFIGIDANWIVFGHTLQTRFEYKKDRSATLALSNNQVTESLSEEIAQDAAFELLKINDFASLKNDPYGIERFVDGLKNHLLNPELQEEGSILRKIIKEEINK